MTFQLKTGDRVVFAGDSITRSEMDVYFPPFGKGFVAIFAMLVGARHPEIDLGIVNAGVDGETIVDLVARWPSILEANPSKIFLMIGCNDVLYRRIPNRIDRAVDDQRYEEHLEKIIKMTPNSTARLVLVEPNPPSEWPRSEDLTDFDRLNAIIRNVAARHDLAVVPVFRPMLDAIHRSTDRRYWMENDPHPHFKGHAWIALRLLEHLGW